MMSKTEVTHSIGLGGFSITMLLGVLKLAGVPYLATASWWLITALLWLPIAIAGGLVLAAAVGVGIFIGVGSLVEMVRGK